MLSVHDLVLSIGQCRVADGASVTFGAGERWAILGPNGSGKTTLLHTLAGIRNPSSGQIRLDGKVLDQWPGRELARQIGLLPQSSQERFPSQVMDVCLTGLHPHLSRWQWEGPEESQAIAETLAGVGLSGMEDRWIQSLSGGEMQRLLFAVLLLQNPRLWLMDEPTNHLDLTHQISLLERVCHCIEDQAGVGIFVLHDVNLAARFCDHVVLLDGNGGFSCGAAAELLEAERLSELYGVEMGLQRIDGRMLFYLR